MDKLKKLGKYFTKGLQAGVLATALIAGNVSCSNSAGGSTVEDPIVTSIPPKDNTESTWPSYYIKDKDQNLTGQRFVEDGAYWLDKGNKNQEFSTHYDDANQYIKDKVEELQKLWQEKNTPSTMTDEINTVLNGFNKGSSIAAKIDNNYDALTPVFAAMRKTIKNANGKFQPFTATYYSLAADAYKLSVSEYKNDTSQDFPAIYEMQNLPGRRFTDELEDAGGLSYADVTANAKTMMTNHLSTIARNTNTNAAVLKKIIELALYNESLYGLHDYAKQVGVSNQTFTEKRRIDVFADKVDEKYQSMSTNYSLDDRTM